MGVFKHHDVVASLVAKALASPNGRQLSLVRYEWDMSGNCTDPQRMEIVGRPKVEGVKTVVVSRGSKATLYLDMITRCRACLACLKVRRQLWFGRAVNELRAASRTWFGSLTYKPQEHVRLLAKARLAKASDFDALTPQQQFRYMAKVSGADLTRYLKRVRKISKAPIRYLAVAERHKSGLIHWHMLLHETDDDMPVRHALLKGQWAGRHGYCDWKLIDETSAGSALYVVKYLGKAMDARVRASVAYGNPALKA